MPQNNGNDRVNEFAGFAVLEPQSFIANDLSAMYVPSGYVSVPINAQQNATPFSHPIYGHAVPILYKDVQFVQRPKIALETPSVVVLANPDNLTRRLITG